MEFNELKIFIALAEYGSMVKTAHELAMTQPGVSQHLARLESELGQKLFDRIGKRLEINDFGLDLLEKAKKIVADMDGLKEIKKGRYCPIGSLKLGLTDSAAVTIIPPALVKLRKFYPGIKISIDVFDSREIEHGVLRGHYDIGLITAGERGHPALEVDELYHDHIDALVSKHHPLARTRSVALTDLARYPLLVYPRHSRTRQLIDNCFHVKNIHPKEIMDIYSNSSAARLAEVGIGVALLSKAFIMSEMQKHKCAHLRVKGDPFKRIICMIRKRNITPSDATKCFYDIMNGIKGEKNAK